MNIKYDGLIFDMDGIIVDVSRSYREAIRQTAGYFLKRNVLMSEVNAIKNKIGMNNDWDATYVLINRPTIDYESVRAYFQKIYLDDLINNEKLLIPKQKLKLLKNKLEKIFDCIVALEDVVNSKPFPDSLLAVIKKLDLKQTVYIGDSPSDVLAARAAQIPSIFIGKQKIGTLRFSTILKVIQYLL